MSETTYIERYWRDAKPEDAIKEPPMMARFRDKDTTNWGKPCTLTGWDRGGDLLWSNGSCFWKYCQVYDAPDPGEGYELVDITKTTKQVGDEVLSDDGKWVLADPYNFVPKLHYRRRITPAVAYVPFTWEDREQLRGRWVARDNQELQLVNLDNSDGFHANGVHAENLCRYWKFLDTGKPVGKEVTSAN